MEGLSKHHYEESDDFLQAASLPRFRQGRVVNNRPPAQPAWRRRPVGRLFTTLRASVLHRALQTFRATRSMFTTLYAGIRRSQTHTYARSLTFSRHMLDIPAQSNPAVAAINIKYSAILSAAIPEVLLSLEDSKRTNNKQILCILSRFHTQKLEWSCSFKFRHPIDFRKRCAAPPRPAIPRKFNIPRP